MNEHMTDIQWLDTHQRIARHTLAELSGLSDDELKLLTEYGVLECIEAQAAEPVYRAECLVMARAAARLRQDLDLGMESLALVMDLLRRMRRLEAELDDLRARFPGGL